MPITKRSVKGVKLDKEELDGNFEYIEGELNNSPRLLKDQSEDIIGFTGGNKNFPIVEKPVECLYISAIPSSCSLTATDEPLDSITINSGILGVNSTLQIEPVWSFTNSANIKTCKVSIGGISVYNKGRTTSVKEAPLIVIANRNSLTSQIKPYDDNYVVAGTTAIETFSIDFSNNITINIIGNRANSGDTLTLEYIRIIHFVGD